MPTRKIWFSLFLLFFSFVIRLILPSLCLAQELPPQDVVFLVDSSDSADPYLPALAEILKRFVNGARTGDSFTCYQFSNNPVLIAQGKVRRQSDISTLKTQLQQLHGSGTYTNYSPTVEKGLSEIYRSFHEFRSHDRLLVLVTDGRSSTDIWSEKINLDALLNNYDISAGIDYLFVCFYLGDSIESDLQSFLHSAGARLVFWPKDERWLKQLTLAEIRVVEREKNLGGVLETPSQSGFTLSFFPRRPPSRFTMIELDLEENLTEKTLDRLFDLRPRRIECRNVPWTETFTLETRGFQRGNYSGRFLFSPSEPQVLLLYPTSVPFHFAVSEALRVVAPQPLRFGPTGLSGAYREVKDIYIRSEEGNLPASLLAIVPEVDITLPVGMRLNTSLVMKDGEIVVRLELSRDKDAAEAKAGEHTGVLTFSSPTGWTFTQDKVPISVSVQKKPFDFRRFLFHLGIAAGAICIVALSLLSVAGIRSEVADYLAHKANPVGRLVPVKDPSMGLARTMNLSRLAAKKKNKSVLVGPGEEVDVDLAHISMVDKAFLFTGLRTQETVNTLIEAVKGGDKVIINGIPRVGKVPLKHLDHVKMGGFEFRYEEPLPLQQVVLYYLSGEVQQGWLLDWNISTEGFRILKRDEAAQPSELCVQFCELKAVAFLRDFDGDLTGNPLSLKVPRKGHLVRVIFADQEEVTGYVFDWRNPAAKFYLFPDSMGDNILFLLIERQTLKELKLIKEDQARAMQAQKQFEKILRKMSRQFRTNT